jgi:hypothetical protein
LIPFGYSGIFCPEVQRRQRDRTAVPAAKPRLKIPAKRMPLFCILSLMFFSAAPVVRRDAAVLTVFNPDSAVF